MSKPETRTLSFREALREAMVEEMERDPNIFLMGEEVGYYNGAYKVSEGHAREVRREARHRHADRGNGFRGCRHRGGDGRHAADHRVHDVELLARGVRSAREQRREAALHDERPVHAADRLPRARPARPTRSVRSTRRRSNRSTRTCPG
jgi:hypothetical protein